MYQYEKLEIPSKPVWEGPLKGGVTQSLLNNFLECPFRFFLKYYMGLQEPKATDERLIWGDCLHVGLEHKVKGDPIEKCTQIMHDYMDENYPTAPATYRYTTKNMLELYSTAKTDEWGGVDTEVDIQRPYDLLETVRISNLTYENVLLNKCPQMLTAPSVDPEMSYVKCHDILLRGKADMLAHNRKHIGDHKAKGRSAQSPEHTKKELNQDLQMNLYSFCFDYVNDWLYDIILIPEDRYDVPPRRVGEKPEAWADRIFYVHRAPTMGYPIANQPRRWINQTPHWQTTEMIENYMAYTINPIIMRLMSWWDHVTHPKFDPNDPTWYNAVFYRGPVRTFDPAKTKMFECNFYNFLIGEAPMDTLINVKSFYPELEEQDAEASPTDQ